MDPIVATLVVLVGAVALFMSNRLPIGIVAILVSLSLWATGVLDIRESLAGFGDPTVIFIAALFVVSEALDATGVTAWLGAKVVPKDGAPLSRLLVPVMVMAALVTALITPNGSVAALLPVAVVIAARANVPPSLLLLPLAFAAHAGSMLTLTGTPVNILVSDSLTEVGERPFGFFEFAWVGVPLVAGTIAIVALLGPKVLPRREPAVLGAAASDHARVLAEHYGLSTATPLLARNYGVVEVVIPQRSELIGLRVFPGMVTPSGDLVVLAAKRGGEDLKGDDADLQAGDSLLLKGTWSHLDEHTRGPAVLVVDSADSLRRSVPLSMGAKTTLVITGLMVALLVSGLVPPVVAGLGAAMALVLSRVVSVKQAHRSISWTTVILVAGMIPLSTAFTTTGAAALVAENMIEFLGDVGPQVALAALCVLVMALGQVISNMATVLIAIPVAFALATDYGASPLPFMMALTVAGAASFLTPIATPANTMVMEPGGFRFGDYWKLGLPLMAFFFAVAVFLVPVIWPL